MIENDISFKIRGAIFRVYNGLGPGLLESCYEVALAHVLTEMGLDVKRQVEVPVTFE
jgi:GxxExxY protein